MNAGVVEWCLPVSPWFCQFMLMGGLETLFALLYSIGMDKYF